MLTNFTSCINCCYYILQTSESCCRKHNIYANFMEHKIILCPQIQFSKLTDNKMGAVLCALPIRIHKRNNISEMREKVKLFNCKKSE